MRGRGGRLVVAGGTTELDRMNRRAFLGTAAGALLAPAGAIAQPAARTWRIGYPSLVSGDLP